MPSTYHCGNENRRQAVRTSLGPGDTPALNGIDFLEIGEPGQTLLDVTFIHPVPGESDAVPGGQPALTSANFEIDGGERITGIRVVSATTNAERIRLTTDAAGDFSRYTLRLVAAPGSENPPPGFDPRLAAIEFSFKAACPSPFDCRSDAVCDPGPTDAPRLDYLARDYQSFRRVLLDRLRLLMPDYIETSPVDFPIAMTELLAYVGDHFAYAQDANTTEAYPGTARRRISVKRHARLRDYWMHEGCNARTWVHLRVETGGAADGLLLQTGMRFFAGPHDDRVRAEAGRFDEMDFQKSLVFESMEPLVLRPEHNAFAFYTWSDHECSLCEGARAATLRRPAGAHLQVGHVLVFEETRDPTAPADSKVGGRPDWRWAVRLTAVSEDIDILTGEPLYNIEWAEADALPFSFVISRRVDDVLVENISVAVGNVVLADHGLTMDDSPANPNLEPPRAPDAGKVYRPTVRQSHLTFRHALPSPGDTAASLCVRQQAAEARAQIRLVSLGEAWHAVGDLLGSDREAAEFVVEIDNARHPHLRFGLGEHGRAPTPGQNFTARLRVGNGTAGNTGANTLVTLLDDPGGVLEVRNPLPAVGGTEPESIEQVRQFAPVAFRTQRRAVTLEDYEDFARQYPGVQKAKAEFRWLASWYTVMIAVDRVGGLEIDDAFRDGLVAHLERFRLAGYDLEVRDPLYVPLDIALELCLVPGADRGAVLRELNERLGSGRNGFFNTERLTFGQRIYGSRLIAIAMEAGGVDHARLVRLKRFREPAGNELDDGYLEVSGLELPRLANNPSFPEHGRIEFILKGGF